MAEPVNLFSDTQTLPTGAMRRAMAAADVGDEQLGLDPTVNALQERVAALLGHEAALLLPTGTMCNVIGIALHVRPGEQVLLGRDAHPVHHEAAGATAIAGAVLTELSGEGGMFTADEVRAAFSPAANRYAAATRLVAVEQTTNLGGGRVWPAEALTDVLAAARDLGLRTHLDGARLLNAAVASGTPPAQIAGGFDTAWLDFTKGLGAPVGACLAGSAELIAEAWRFKQRLGGAMRQAGIVAAGALHALEHHVDRLAEDHARAKRLAEGLAELPGVTVDPALVETNIVVFEVAAAGAFAGGLWERDVRVSPLGPTKLRAVTHLDVDDADIDRALTAAREVAASV